MGSPELLPVAGFVLAGGKSSRMGTDKALLPFCGRPMIEIAVEKLRGFCAEVGIAGNRDDLSGYAAVVHESRIGEGPVAGVEAGLSAARQSWVMFLPVDVPLVPMELLRDWLRVLCREEVAAGCAVSYLLANGERQPAFCAIRRECLRSVTAALESGERRLAHILMEIGGEDETGRLWVCDAAQFAPGNTSFSDEMEFWFSNINDARDLAAAEAWAFEKDGKLRSGAVLPTCSETK